jgi:hypothetical protein
VAGGLIGLLGLAGLTTAAAQASPEQVILPVRCQVAQGRVVLMPRPDQAHAILGPYKSHSHTTCAPGQPDRCRTWTIHKFDLACGHARIPWLSVVAAANDRRGTVAVENGRLLLALGPGLRALIRTPEAGWLAFPPGYAPAIGLTARFPGQPATPAPTVVADRPGRPEPVRPDPVRPDSVRLAAMPPAAQTEALASPPLTVAPTTAAEGWLTVVEREVLERGRAVSRERALVVLALVLAVWALLALVRHRRLPSATDAGAGTPATGANAGPQPDDAAGRTAALIAQVVNLHRAARDALPAIASDSLRQLLREDLDRVQASLLTTELTQQIADGHWTAVHLVVSAALIELERIGRTMAGVLDSARAEPVQYGAEVRPPETTHDAFVVLGLNPQASRAIVKKVVDGLRQSWHPDHAHDENDRVRREARMKQINAAWDLIRADLPETNRPAA